MAVILGLWFGGWLWGVAGVALAMPVMIAVKTALNTYREAHSEDGRGLVPVGGTDRDDVTSGAAMSSGSLRMTRSSSQQ